MKTIVTFSFLILLISGLAAQENKPVLKTIQSTEMLVLSGFFHADAKHGISTEQFDCWRSHCVIPN